MKKLTFKYFLNVLYKKYQTEKFDYNNVLELIKNDDDYKNNENIENTVKTVLGQLVKRKYILKDDSEKYNIEIIHNFSEFQNKLNNFKEKNPNKRLYYRGEGDLHDYVIPSIYRSTNNNIFRNSNNFYSDLLVHLGNLKFANENRPSQLSRLQHYQAPH